MKVHNNATRKKSQILVHTTSLCHIHTILTKGKFKVLKVNVTL